MSNIIGIIWAVIISVVTVSAVVWGAFVPYKNQNNRQKHLNLKNG